MREDIKKVVANYQKKQKELQKQKDMKQLMEYLHAIGYHANIFKGDEPTKDRKKAKYGCEVSGTLNVDVEYPLDLTDEELKELYTVLPPQEVLKTTQTHYDETCGKGLRIWSKILLVLSVLTGLGFIIYSFVYDDGIWFGWGLGIILTFIPLSAFYRTVADIAVVVARAE